MTAARFVPDPFSGRPGARLYQTGDVGRWRGSGRIELAGRADRQVKIRGYRVESLARSRRRCGPGRDIAQAAVVSVRGRRVTTSGSLATSLPGRAVESSPPDRPA